MQDYCRVRPTCALRLAAPHFHSSPIRSVDQLTVAFHCGELRTRSKQLNHIIKQNGCPTRPHRDENIYEHDTQTPIVVERYYPIRSISAAPH